MRFVNLTPHEIVVEPLDGPAVRLPATRPAARVAEVIMDSSLHKTPDGVVEVHQIELREVEHLPDPAPDTMYVVSSMVAAAQPGRKDLVSPYGEVRHASGRVRACRGLARRGSISPP